MRKLIFSFVILLSVSCANSQVNKIKHSEIEEDLNVLLADLSQSYAYLKEKNVDLNCIKAYYRKQIEGIKTEEEKVLFFEYLLDEFYDSHLILNTNRTSSFRLYSPLYVTVENGRIIVSNIWHTAIENPGKNIIGAEVKKVNGVDIEKAIKDFPTHCSDKSDREVKEWIANKILAGRYNEPRILSLELSSKNGIQLNLDDIEYKSSKELLTSRRENGIGIIRINNSLGNNSLIPEFDKSLNDLMDTKGLIIDLRNTVNGGNSYVARGIMSRFVNEPHPYQKHSMMEQYGDNPQVERSWIEYVSPRASQYDKPVVVLVGRWTGSMGEGIAVGFDGIRQAKVVGSEMERLAGEMSGFSFKNQAFGYRLSTAKLFHIYGTPREEYVPEVYVKQTTIEKDEILEKGLEVLKAMIK